VICVQENSTSSLVDLKTWSTQGRHDGDVGGFWFWAGDIERGSRKLKEPFLKSKRLERVGGDSCVRKGLNKDQEAPGLI